MYQGKSTIIKQSLQKKTCREEENGKAMVKEKRATIKDVAALSGVSISTVSRYLSNPESVKPFAAYKIKDAVNQLGYVPNTFARSLRKGGSKTIGVVMLPLSAKQTMNQIRKSFLFSS